MKEWKVYHCGEEMETIKSLEELENFIIKIKNNFKINNPIIELLHPEGHVLTIGIKNNLGFLNFSDSTAEPPYFTSVGNSSLKIEDGVEIFDCGEATEIPLRNCISFNLLLETVKKYYQTSELPKTIEWEED